MLVLGEADELPVVGEAAAVAVGAVLEDEMSPLMELRYRDFYQELGTCLPCLAS